MKKDIKKILVDALIGIYLTEDGEPYKKTTKHLKDDTGFCCLGVLCDIQRRTTMGNKNWEDEDEDGKFCYLGETEVLPSAVIKWAGFKSSNPIVGGNDLAWLNDEKIYGEKSTLNSFEKIAGIINEHE